MSRADFPKAALCPAPLLAAAGLKRERTAATEKRLIEEDLPDSQAQALEWLYSDECRGSIEGQGGDQRTFSTAAMMHSFGLSEGTALDLLLEVYNSKCEPPWSYEEMAVKVANAYEYATSPFGNRTSAYRNAKIRSVFKDQTPGGGSPVPAAIELPSGGQERTQGKFRAVNGLGMKDIKPPEMLIEGFLAAESYIMLVGAPGSGKTFIGLGVGMHISTGGRPGSPWGNVLRSGPVGMAVGEGRSGLHVRKHAWEEHYNGGEEVKDFVLLDPVPLVSGGEAEWADFVDLALSFHSDYALMVIDTAGRAMQGVNENAQEHASKLTQMVQFIQAKLKCAVLVLHHTGYGEGAKDRARGSSVFVADIDTGLLVTRQGKEKTVELTITKQKDIPEDDKPVLITLADVGASLVAVPATEAQAGRIAKDGDRSRDAAFATVIERAIVDVLRNNMTAHYSDSQVVGLLLQHASIGEPPSDRTMKRHVAAAARRKGSPCAAMYDVRRPTHKGRWHYVGDDAPVPSPPDDWVRGQDPFAPRQPIYQNARRRRPG